MKWVDILSGLRSASIFCHFFIHNSSYEKCISELIITLCTPLGIYEQFGVCDLYYSTFQSMVLNKKNPPITGIYPLQRPVMIRVEVFAVSLNKLRNKQSRYRWFWTPWHSFGVTVVFIKRIVSSEYKFHAVVIIVPWQEIRWPNWTW